MSLRGALLLVMLAVCLWAPARLVLAQGPTIQEIRIEGNQRIETESIASYLTLKPGDPFDTARMDKSLKALFDTGLFADVTLRREGDTLVVRVVENPIINRIAFEGNSKISDETLSQEVQLRPRVVYTRTRVQNDVKRILDLYRRSGRFAATVEPKVIPLPQNRVDLVFEINEGSVTGIQRIAFIGNHVFSSSRLREVVQTVETAWWRFLSSDDTYDPDRVNYDKELLRRFYLANGYADFRVVSAVAELVPDKEGFFVTFTVDEGERYKFGKVDLTSTLKNLEAERLKALVIPKEGDWYNADQVEGTINAITDYVGTLGYAFVDVRPQVSRDRDAKSIAVTFDVREGPKVFVERINISGNTRTMDKVIRREFQLAEGDAFNTAKMRRSQQRLKNLGFFENVDVTNAPGTAPDQTVVDVQVKEKSTGELALGAGFSSTEGPIGNFGISEKNLMGTGQEARGFFTISQRTQELDLGYTEPYLFDRNLSAGVDLFRITRFLRSERGFNELDTGGKLRFGYDIADPWSQQIHYTLQATDLKNLNDNVSSFIRDQQGNNLKSEIGQDLLYDLRDNRRDPTNGYYFKIGSDLAGLGGSDKFVRGRFGAGNYIPIADDWVVSITGESGVQKSLNNRPVRLNDRFFLGGDTLRGFATSGVGPRDLNSSDAIGGTWYYSGTTELSFPLGLPKEFGILGKLFADFGSIGAIDLPNNAQLVDQPSLRASLGFGIGWRSPFGPIRVDIAKPVLKKDFDKTELLHISFGARL
ncbi:MAG: outer membrane protein assembly factor BamA [Alphaproteobacteria bacterium]